MTRSWTLSISGARSRFRSGFATGPLGSGTCALAPVTVLTSSMPENQIIDLIDRGIVMGTSFGIRLEFVQTEACSVQRTSSPMGLFRP